MLSPGFAAGSIRLASGRRVAFSELGDRDGRPVLYLHGAIGTALDPMPELVAVVERHDLRWIAVERPGFGRSCPAPGRSMLDFAADVEELADALGLGTFWVIGVSAGGPYALACGHRLAGRVAAIAICSSLSPLAAPYSVAGVPARLRLPLRALAAAPGPGTRALGLVAAGLRAHPAPRRPAAAALRAAVAGGVEGLVEDYLLSCRPWGFDPHNVRVPVHLWHGARDRIVPAEHAWQLAASLPVCRAAFAADEGHFFFRRRVGEIVGQLVTEARVAQATRRTVT